MKRAFLLVLLTAVAACGRPDPVADEAKNTDALPPVEANSASPSGGPPNTAAVPEPVEQVADAAIPTALQGRWGLAPGDCTSTRGDAKGLLIVGPHDLRFYESRAVPAAEVETSGDSISGEFNFTGEGQSWTRHLTLERQDHKLVRTERDPTASFTYARC